MAFYGHDHIIRQAGQDGFFHPLQFNILLFLLPAFCISRQRPGRRHTHGRHADGHTADKAGAHGGIQFRIGFTDNRIRATVLVQLVYKSLYIIMPDLEKLFSLEMRNNLIGNRTFQTVIGFRLEFHPLIGG